MSTALDIIVVVLLVVGGLFCIIAALGIVVMTDVYNRMQAASKAVTFGAAAIVFAVAVHFRELDIVARCVLVCIFLFVTIPAASHLLARVAYRNREPLAPETVLDELADETSPS
jgi:multicomponent Na+:H+ antiporter subunit G